MKEGKGFESDTGFSACLEKAANLPQEPGVYIFSGPGGEVLYVGKARNLRRRVGSYFRDASPRVEALLKKAVDLNFIVTSTEKEALLLEASLIKRHQPRYNIVLRDDKNYPILRIDTREPYPRIEIVRRFSQDGATYFGPYPSASSVRSTLRMLNHLFPLRKCKTKQLKQRQRPCLNHSLGRCLAPCCGRISQSEYKRMVQELILFLRGRTEHLEHHLEKQMMEAAARLDYERAAAYRDRLKAVRTFVEKQDVVSNSLIDQDVIGIHINDRVMLAVLFVRHGVLVGQRSFPFQVWRDSPDEILTSFMLQYYTDGRLIPDEIIVPYPPRDSETLEEILRELRGKKVNIRLAHKGKGKVLIDLANRNAKEQSLSFRRSVDSNEKLLQDLQTLLELPRFPRCIACVDISNLQGRHAVGSVVVFVDGQPDYARYRRFVIKGKNEPDDPGMMAEVVERYIREHKPLAQSLDLLVLDGGKGQLSRVSQLISQMELDYFFPVIALAKERPFDRGREGRGLYEKVYLPERKDPLFLTEHPQVLFLLQRLRDEAHRYAISFYKKLHRRYLLASSLDAIPGVGKKRRKLLLEHFHTLERIQQASPKELQDVPGISPRLAERIYRYLNQESS